MGKWRIPERRYHDPLRAELADGREVVSPEEVLRRYRLQAIRNAESYVRKALIPQFPAVSTALIAAAGRVIREIPDVPGKEALRAHANRLADRWLAIIPLPAVHRVALERSLAEFVLKPARHKKWRGRA